MPTHQTYTRSFRRVTQRVAPAFVAVASVFLFATCDFDKISSTPTPIDQQTLDRLFSIAPPGDSLVTLGASLTLRIEPGPGVDLTHTSTRWSSSAANVAAVDSLTGVVAGVSAGTATIKARVLAPELDTGYSKTHQVRVRFKGIKVASLDSITGLNLSRPVVVNGTNNANAIVSPAITGATLSTHDSGGTANTIAAIGGANVFARKNGIAYVVALFDNFKDSVKVKVRQVAKSLIFPDTVYTATSLNTNQRLPFTAKDVNDSVMTSSPGMRWRTSDTSVVTIDALTGVFRVKKLDSTFIFVRVDTVERSQMVRVQQVSGSLTKFAGDEQADTIARTLAIAPRVTVLDSGGVAIAGATVTFSVASGGGVITDSVQTTDANGRATLGSWTLGLTAGEQTIVATSGPANTIFIATARPAQPSKVGFETHPVSVAIGATMAPVRAAVQDSAGNTVTTATNVVSIGFGNNPSGASLSGTLNVAAIGGIATFSNLSISAGGSRYTLQASSGTLGAGISNSFDAFGAAAKLGFVSQPVGTTAGGIMAPIRVAVQDAQGNTVTTATNAIAITIGTNPGSASLGGTSSASAVAGVATFSDLSVSAPGTGYRLKADPSGGATLTAGTSGLFDVVPVGAASKLTFSVQPSNAVAGAAIAPAIKVRVEDINGALVTSSTQQIALRISTNPGGGTPGGTLAVNAEGGEATFTNVTINRAGTGYRLTADAPGTTLSSATSGGFNITPGTATKLGFVQGPTHFVAGQTMAPVTVAIQDANNNTVTSAPATAISLSLAGSGCTATMTGTGPVNTTNGVATFTAIGSATTFNNCSLQASGGTFTGGSNSFNAVSSTGAVRVRFTTQPPSSTTAGVTMDAGTVSIQTADGASATATSTVQISISVLSGPGPIACCPQTNRSTTTSVSFPEVAFHTAGTYRLLASATGFRSDTSAEFTISAAAASRLGWVTQPHNIVAGVPFSNTVQVAVQDNFGNTITSATNRISLNANLRNSPFTGMRFNNGEFNIAADAVKGVASFPGLSVRGAGAGIGIHAGTVDFGAGSIAFDVTAGPVSALGFVQQPPNNVTAGVALSPAIRVQAQDSVGNVIAGFGPDITVAITGGAAGAALRGTKTATPEAGIATFTDLSVDKAASGYRLTSSASGLNSGESNAFTVNPGPTVKLRWVDQPQNTFANAPFNPSGQLPRVAYQDSLGNTQREGSNLDILILNPPAGMTLRQNNQNLTGGAFVNGPDCSEGSTTCGIATIPATLTINTHGTGIRLIARSHNGNFSSDTSAAFNIAAFDTKTKLGFAQQPTNSSYGVDFIPVMKVAVQDIYGNTDTTATETVSLALSTNPGTATLSTTSLAAVKGVAAFSPLTLNKVGDGYVITASAAGTNLTSVPSSAFNVTLPGVVAKDPPAHVCDLTRSGNTIYWVDCSNAGSLRSVPVTGGTRAELVVGIANPNKITSDGTNVYWTEFGTTDGQAAVKKYNIASGAVTIMASGLFNIHSGPGAFETDSTNVYFLARNGAGTTNAIRSVPTNVTGATTPTDLFSPANSCTGCAARFTVAGGFIFFYDHADGAIKRMTTSGGTVTPITATVQGSTQLFALSGTTLIMSQTSNLKTLADATTTTTPVTPVTQIASGAKFMNWVLDGTSLYANNNGALLKYPVSNFLSPTNLGVGLDANGNQRLVTNSLDVFVFGQNPNWIVKVPK